MLHSFGTILPFISTNNIHTQHTQRFLTPYTHLWYSCKQTRKTRTRCCKFKQAICHIFPEYTYMYETNVRVKDRDVHSNHHQHHGGAESITNTRASLTLHKTSCSLSKIGRPFSRSHHPLQAALPSKQPYLSHSIKTFPHSATHACMRGQGARYSRRLPLEANLLPKKLSSRSSPTLSHFVMTFSHSIVRAFIHKNVDFSRNVCGAF